MADAYTRLILCNFRLKAPEESKSKPSEGENQDETSAEAEGGETDDNPATNPTAFLQNLSKMFQVLGSVINKSEDAEDEDEECEEDAEDEQYEDAPVEDEQHTEDKQTTKAEEKGEKRVEGDEVMTHLPCCQEFIDAIEEYQEELKHKRVKGEPSDESHPMGSMPNPTYNNYKFGNFTR